MAATRAEAVSRALEQLYAAPFDAFVPLRKELARQAKVEAGSEGAAAAREVLAAPKPTRTAWGLNQVARGQPSLVKALLAARDAAGATHTQGDAEAIHRATREYRARVSEVTHAARDAMAAAGFGASPAQLRRMAETLATASVEGSEARALLVAGRLSEDVEVDDPFAGLEAGAPREREEPEEPPEKPEAPAKKPEAPAKKSGPSPDEVRAAEAARHAQEKRAAARKAAEQRVAALEAELKEAQSEAYRRERARARAVEAAEAAQRAATTAQKAAEDATKTATEAEKSATATEARLEAAQEELARLPS